MKTIRSLFSTAIVAGCAFLQGCAAESTPEDQSQEDLETRSGITCQVFAGNADTAGSAQRTASLLFKSKFLSRANQDVSVSIPFTTPSGQVRPMNVSIKRVNLSISGAALTSESARIGADYSFNNPFEAGSIFARNDVTGQTTVRGSHFVFEGESNALDQVELLRGKKNYSIFNPYLIMKMSPQAPEDQLIGPDGQRTNYVVLSCVITTAF
jgi:hypothetical protein